MYYLFAQDIPESVADEAASHVLGHQRVLVEAHERAVHLPAKKLQHLGPIGRLELDSEAAKAGHVLGPDELYGLRLKAQPTDHKIVLGCWFHRLGGLAREDLHLNWTVELHAYIQKEVFVV